jgi:hypothetical protein
MPDVLEPAPIVDTAPTYQIFERLKEERKRKKDEWNRKQEERKNMLKTGNVTTKEDTNTSNSSGKFNPKPPTTSNGKKAPRKSYQPKKQRYTVKAGKFESKAPKIDHMLWQHQNRRCTVPELSINTSLDSLTLSINSQTSPRKFAIEIDDSSNDVKDRILSSNFITINRKDVNEIRLKNYIGELLPFSTGWEQVETFGPREKFLKKVENQTMIVKPQINDVFERLQADAISPRRSHGLNIKTNYSSSGSMSARTPTKFRSYKDLTPTTPRSPVSRFRSAPSTPRSPTTPRAPLPHIFK